MNTLNQVLSFYDQIISSGGREFSIFLSLLILILLALSILSLIRHGHWIYILIATLLLPGGIIVARNVGLFVLIIVKFLITRIQANI